MKNNVTKRSSNGSKEWGGTDGSCCTIVWWIVWTCDDAENYDVSPGTSRCIDELLFFGGERRWAVCNRISLQSHSTNINVSSRWYSHFWGSVGGKTVQFASVKERRRKFETPPANPTLQTLQTRRDLSHVYDAFSFFLQTRRARQQQQTGGPVFRNRPCELFPFFSAALHPFRRYEKCRVFQSMNFIVRSHPVHSGFSNQKYNWKRN